MNENNLALLREVARLVLDKSNGLIQTLNETNLLHGKLTITQEHEIFIYTFFAYCRAFLNEKIRTHNFEETLRTFMGIVRNSPSLSPIRGEYCDKHFNERNVQYSNALENPADPLTNLAHEIYKNLYGDTGEDMPDAATLIGFSVIFPQELLNAIGLVKVYYEHERPNNQSVLTQQESTSGIPSFVIWLAIVIGIGIISAIFG